jgi:ABC-type tungstate transport system substrate-binding protein
VNANDALTLAFKIVAALALPGVLVGLIVFAVIGARHS